MERQHHLSPWVLVGCAAVLWGALINWTAPLSELHDFRQSQTALSAYWMLREGVSFLKPPLPLFGVEQLSTPLEFPLYQAITGAIAQLVGGANLPAIIVAGRLVSFASFLLAAVALHRLVSLFGDERFAAIATVLFLSLPFPLYWSTSVMIEGLALAATLAYAEAICRTALREDERWWTILWGGATGIVAMLVKTTTPLIYGPALLVAWCAWVQRRHRTVGWVKVILASLIVGATPLAVGYAWLLWSDHVKAQSALTVFLTSGANVHWNFGDLSTRLEARTWILIGGYWVLQVLAIACVPFALAGAYWMWRHKRLQALFWISIPLTAVLVFTPLYRQHTYYSIALMPALIVLTAWGVQSAARYLAGGEPATRYNVIAVGATVAAAWVCLALQALVPGLSYPERMLAAFRGAASHDSPRRQRDLGMAEMIRTYTDPSSVVAIAVGDWIPVVPLLAERRALMLLHCGTELATNPSPRIDMVAIDRQRSRCASLDVPTECRVAERDGIVIGRCLSNGQPPALTGDGRSTTHRP